MYFYVNTSEWLEDSNVNIVNDILSKISQPIVKMTTSPIQDIEGITYRTLSTDFTSKIFTGVTVNDLSDLGIELDRYVSTMVTDMFEKIGERNLPTFKIKNTKKIADKIFKTCIQKCLNLSDVFCYRSIAHIICVVEKNELSKMVKNENYLPLKYTLGLRTRLAVPMETYNIIEAYQQL
jgi:hypothetical protein